MWYVEHFINIIKWLFEYFIMKVDYYNIYQMKGIRCYSFLNKLGWLYLSKEEGSLYVPGPGFPFVPAFVKSYLSPLPKESWEKRWFSSRM